MFKFESLRLITNLESLKSRLNGKLAAAVTVPDDMAWWYYHEFGTATWRGGEKYAIRGVRLPITSQYSEEKLLPVVWHPGVRPLHYVQNSLEKIRGQSQQMLAQALQGNDYNIDSLHDALINEVMPNIVEIIATSMGEVLGNKTRDRMSPGAKLGGASPDAVFREGAEIVDQTE